MTQLIDKGCPPFKFIRKREFPKFRLDPLASCVMIVRRESVDRSRENMLSNRVDAHIGALDKRLELGWTPADLIGADSTYALSTFLGVP